MFRHRARISRSHAYPLSAAALVVVVLGGCADPTRTDEAVPEARSVAAPSILLITLDTLRADHLGVESGSNATPALDELAKRGVRFEHAYTTAPTTLPAHTSLFTGRYPAEHGVHENFRRVPATTELLARRLRDRGYSTAAVISGLPLSRRFGLAEGFGTYIDEFPDGAAERRADLTTDLALEILSQAQDQPLFLWVHYFDAHEPYAPPEDFATRYPDDPYLAEIAYLDRELGRLVTAFESRGTDLTRIIVVGDHGEGLGDHGEWLHGNLLYDEVMRVPLILVTPTHSPAVESKPVSTRRVFDTILGWSSGEPDAGLLGADEETVLAEAMKPHLQYGWQPQVMAVRGSTKAIRSAELEIYDLDRDPGEREDLAGTTRLERNLAEPLTGYPLPVAEPLTASPLSAADRQRLASLGYSDWDGRAPVRENAPSAREMVHLFRDLDRASALFVHGRWNEAVSVFERLLEQDPENLMVALRLAVAYSSSGRANDADRAFERARELAPASTDVALYHGLHLLREGRLDAAGSLFQAVLAWDPQRLEALKGLARTRRAQGAIGPAIDFFERAIAVNREVATLTELGELQMAVTDSEGAIRSFEAARSLAADDFAHDLELGVCYLAVRRVPEARDALDRVARDHPGFPLALFKRAQVSALLGEPDLHERVQRALEAADPELRELIRAERLFLPVLPN